MLNVAALSWLNMRKMAKVKEISSDLYYIIKFITSCVKNDTNTIFHHYPVLLQKTTITEYTLLPVLVHYCNIGK